MAAPIGRSDRRVKKEAVLELARADDPQLKETPIAQNVSDRGLRVATERLAPRGLRAAKVSAVGPPYSGARGLLPTHEKQQVCCGFGTSAAPGRTDQAALVR